MQKVLSRGRRLSLKRATANGLSRKSNAGTLVRNAGDNPTAAGALMRKRERPYPAVGLSYLLGDIGENMSIHVCKCEHKGVTEWHLRYPGMTQNEAQDVADKINAGALWIFEEISYEKHISIANALRDYILKDLAENNPPVAWYDPEHGLPYGMTEAPPTANAVYLYAKPVTTQEWQPIETAPKDGSWIVVTSTHNIYFRVAVQFVCGAWIDVNEIENDDLMRDSATHWMPLPAAPMEKTE